jgi:hypothetical protein
VHKVVQAAVHVHIDPHLAHVQAQAHVEVQDGYEAHQINQHNQEVVLDALRSAQVVQGAVHVHHDPHVPHVQGQAHGEVQEGQEAYQVDQYEQEVVLDALISA